MKRVVTMGEMMIYFTPLENGVTLASVSHFTKSAGGDAAIVAVAVARLGGESAFVGKLGEDEFGQYLVDILTEEGVNTESVLRTDQANTALAFASRKPGGETDYLFYRSPSAGMLLAAGELDEQWFADAIFHFCSICLYEAPIKYAHLSAIDYVRKHNGIVSFDPNIRLPLWQNSMKCRDTILEFISRVDIVKVTEEELYFITGINNVDKAVDSLFSEGVKVIICTHGRRGATLFTDHHRIKVDGFVVDDVDATGAGDAFIGSFLFILAQLDGNLEGLSENEFTKMLRFANAAGALATTKPGAIFSMPDYQTICDFLKTHDN